jgi:hypothetical protein
MNDADVPTRTEQQVLAEVLRAIRRVHFGYVQVIVQEGRAIQIDTMEKKRLGRLPR